MMTVIFEAIYILSVSSEENCFRIVCRLPSPSAIVKLSSVQMLSSHCSLKACNVSVFAVCLKIVVFVTRLCKYFAKSVFLCERCFH